METTIITAIAGGSAEQATAELITKVRAGFAGSSPVMLMAFASTQQPLQAVLDKLHSAFPATQVMGASSAGEFTQEGI